MSALRSSYTAQRLSQNLLGNPEHRQFIRIVALYGAAQRGGATFPFYQQKHKQRLVSDINLFTPCEQKQLVFSEGIFSN